MLFVLRLSLEKEDSGGRGSFGSNLISVGVVGIRVRIYFIVYFVFFRD